MFAGQSVENARRSLTNLLRTHSIDSAELDARLLTGDALGLDLTGLISAANRILTSNEAAQLARFAQRRIDGEPVARVLGTKEFWGLPLQLSPDTLVPRPDTETLVEAALELLDAAGPRDRPLVIADLGTGSGAILLALLSELTNATGIATDINLDALRTARSNAAQLGLIERAHFAVCDYASALAGGFDLIVSNPPYVPAADYDTLQPEIRLYEPYEAVVGDGVWREIARDARALLAPGGHLVLEVGDGQAAEVAEGLAALGYEEVHCTPDLAGRDRTVEGRRP